MASSRQSLNTTPKHPVLSPGSAKLRVSHKEKEQKSTQPSLTLIWSMNWILFDVCVWVEEEKRVTVQCWQFVSADCPTGRVLRLRCVHSTLARSMSEDASATTKWHLLVVSSGIWGSEREERGPNKWPILRQESTYIKVLRNATAAWSCLLLLSNIRMKCLATPHHPYLPSLLMHDVTSESF